MTRKRFIKLLMGRGYQRDVACGYAEVACYLGYDYADAFSQFFDPPCQAPVLEMLMWRFRNA